MKKGLATVLELTSIDEKLLERRLHVYLTLTPHLLVPKVQDSQGTFVIPYSKTVCAKSFLEVVISGRRS